MGGFLQVILAFIDNWVEGVDLYNQFAGVTDHMDFFTNPKVMQLYKDNAKALTGRVNTINGRTYSQDPTIFAWDLINEPRCNADCPAGTIAVRLSEAQCACHVSSWQNCMHHQAKTPYHFDLGPHQSAPMQHRLPCGHH